MNYYFLCDHPRNRRGVARFEMEQEGYPITDAFDSGWLKVSDLHEVYYEQSGKVDGIPILFV